jgi:hypothetical protein
MRSLHLRQALTLSVALIGLTACVAPTAPIEPDAATPYDPNIRTDVELQLSQSAARSANALETLALIQRARTTPAAPAVDESTLPPDLRRHSTVAFTGPAVEVVKQLAALIGYGFLETGNPPAEPGLVTVNDTDVAVGVVLGDVSLQSQRFATIIVNPNTRSIEFRNDTVSGAEPRAAIHYRAARALWAASPHRRNHVVLCTPSAATPVPAQAAPAQVVPAPAPASAQAAGGSTLKPMLAPLPATGLSAPHPAGQLPSGMVPVSPAPAAQ